MRRVHIYHRETGVFTGASFSSNIADEGRAQKFFDSNCPPGHAWIEGVSDHLSQAVNVFTGEIESHRPDRPSLEHDWNEHAKRWELNAAANDRAAVSRNARERIAELEHQARPLTRRALLKPDASVLAQLAAIHDEIEQLQRNQQ